MVYLPLNLDFQALLEPLRIRLMNDEAEDLALFHVVETDNPNKAVGVLRTASLDLT